MINIRSGMMRYIPRDWLTARAIIGLAILFVVELIVYMWPAAAGCATGAVRLVASVSLLLVLAELIGGMGRPKAAGASRRDSRDS